MQKSEVKLVFISWVDYTGRSSSIARALGAKEHYIEYLKRMPRLFIPIRYMLQAVKTLTVTLHEKPDIVLVMNPPVVLPLIAYLYCFFSGAKYIIDSHTGAFFGKWRRFQRLHRYLSKRALTTIVTNEPLRQEVASWGANCCILGLGMPEFSTALAADRSTELRVCVISSFSDDEPLEEITAAAGELPGCRLFVTGRIPNTKRAKIVNRAPSNVVFTDFLPKEQYIELLSKADVAMVLVKRDYTLLQGAIESVAVEKPLIISDWPILRSCFNKGTLYVDNSPESIVSAVWEAKARMSQLQKEMQSLKAELKQEWKQQLTALEALF